MTSNALTPPTPSPRSELDTVLDQQKLMDSLEVAASNFSAARNQDERLWTLCHYLSVVRHILNQLDATPKMLEPHNALSQALAAQALGSPHPLLASADINNRPSTLPARLIEQIAAVLASEILHRGGMKCGEADAAAARLVSALGVEGGPSRNLATRTVTKWRSNAGQFGESSIVGRKCAEYLAAVPLELDIRDATTAAKDFAVSILATRYQAKDSPEG